MSIELNNLLVALVFLLPGFLTSRLISARTPAVGREVSAFQETFESLLRSVYIHLLIAPLFFAVFWYFFVGKNAYLLDQIHKGGLQAYYLARPFETIILVFGWLFVAFLLAVIFGFKWDPLDVLISRLVNKTGTKSEDLFYQLRGYLVAKKIADKDDTQLWVQARLKNGFTYRGKLVFAGYRRDGMSRELMLSDVKFYAHPIQATEQVNLEPKLYNFVLIDFANCDSLEVLFGKGTP